MSINPITVRARALAAVDAIPPTFPLSTFVAANPLHGMERHTFEDAAQIAATTTGARAYLAESDYRTMFESGRISDIELRAALGRRGTPGSADPERAVADFLDARSDDPPGDAVQRRRDPHAEAVDGQVAKWCAAYLDQGQAAWEMPHRELGLYGAWRRMAPRDPSLRRLAGTVGRRRVRDLPTSAAGALCALVVRRELDETDLTREFRAAFRRLPGWSSALARSGNSEDLVGFLALLLALEELIPGAAAPHSTAVDPEVDPAITRGSIWQDALELGYRDQLLGLLERTTGADAAAPSAGTPLAEAQMAFCIDVRSEGIRRHLEAVGPYDTIGFAGFFGLPIRIAALEAEPVASCPVIVEPRATVGEVADAAPDVAARRHDRHQAVEAAWEARHDAKVEPAAPFAFAEAAGWVLGPSAALNTVAPRAASRLASWMRRSSVPPIETRMELHPAAPHDGAPAGLSTDEQISMAHGALVTMGLTSGFAPLVVMCGHRSATTNNPFAAALDCGACAGKAGGPNARVLVEMLNDPAVRAGLAVADIVIEPSTWFVAAEHETTTDTVRIADRRHVPVEHLAALDRLEAALEEAGARLAAERLGELPGAEREAAAHSTGHSPGTARASAARGVVHRRSGDWAEPVPEWGLAGNAAVVVGPRDLTAGLDLGRRVFLHSYDSDGDVDGVALGTILTGPLVVGHWISSQYYFSSVDPDRYGAGTKPLHNVVGGIGVLEGPGGDLRIGLPLESVQFAGRRVHEPLRLLAVVQAPRERLEMLIGRNAAVAQLLENGWIRLVAGSNGNDGWAERRRDGTWVPWSADRTDTTAHDAGATLAMAVTPRGAMTDDDTTEVE